MSTNRSTAQHNTSAARRVAEELKRLGCAGVVICPGSRSTPLVAAFAQLASLPLRVLHDERSGAFFALGWARAAGRPIAIVTTSGTAVANLLPAFVEADRDRVPLLALSADRPFESHGTDANQTVNQRDFLQGCARKVLNLAPPDDELQPSALIAGVQEAYHATLSPVPGPVQLNCMFRKPLEPEISGSSPAIAPMEPALRANRPPQVSRPQTPPIPPKAADAIAEALRTSTQGIVLLGATSHEEESRGALQLASFLGWPVIACALANGMAEARGAQAESGTALITQASILAKAQCLPHPPDVVFWLGGATLFPELTQYAGQARSVFRVDAFSRPPSETLNPRLELSTSATELCTALAERGPFPRNQDLEHWRRLQRVAITQAHDAIFAPERADRFPAAPATFHLKSPDDKLDEPSIASLVVHSLGHDDAIFVGNSMPIRDVTLFGGARDKSFRIFSNRGASGIDGLVSTAAGIAAEGVPLVALLGDLSFLYDVSVWTSISQMNLPLRIVVVENGGGGIFDFLPIASHRDLLDPYFYTPHQVNLSHLMAAYGIHAKQVQTHGELWELLQMRPTGVEVIIAKSDRDQNIERHQARYRSLRQAIEDDAQLGISR